VGSATKRASIDIVIEFTNRGKKALLAKKKKKKHDKVPSSDVEVTIHLRS
jgi:hypothetical protein